MANQAKHAGKEARLKLGFWYANRFLVLRRLSQILILAMFLSGPWLGFWILRGNYSSSMLLDTIPLSDPLVISESLFSGHLPTKTALIGVLIIVVFYALIGSRVFCAWCCPVNVVTDLSAWCRRKLGIRQSAKIPRSLRYILLITILLASTISGSLVWEWINPVAAFGRDLIYGFSASLWVILTIFIFDLFIVEHGWCGHICPLGAIHGAIGAKSIIKIAVVDRSLCDNCMDCYNVCPEPQILRNPLMGNKKDPANDSKIILSPNCITCGRCVDVCAEKVFKFTTRFDHQEETK